MSDLTAARDHARKMAAQQPPDLAREPGMRCQIGEHPRCIFGPGTCPCACHDDQRPVVPTDAERALWTQIADEIDAYLARPAEVVDLFGDVGVEPTMEPGGRPDWLVTEDGGVA